MRATRWFLAVTSCFIGWSAASVEAGMPAADVAARVDRLLSTELFAPKATGTASTTSASVSASGGATTTSIKPGKNELAKPADDETFLRRVSLDLTGELPTLNQMTAYALDPAKDKRAKVVNQLLAEDKFGQNWGRYWRDVIMYRRTEDRALIASPALEQYLKDEFNKGTTWDKMATELLTATGNVAENGRTALLMAQQGEAEETAAEVSRIFLGIQIQCAQCHDHPTDKWKRQQFHELAAFFPRIAVRRVDDGDKRGFEVVSVNRARPGAPGGPRRGSTEHYMPDLKDPSARGTLIQPKFFVNQQTLEPGLSDLDRRETLAKWMTSPENPWFAKAFVNRVWSEMVGEGFYEPVDDMGPERHPSAPKTLDLLAREFASSGFDVKWLFRTITATEAYQRASRSRRNIDETPFTASCPQRLRADQLYDAILSALGIAEPAGRGGAPGNGPYARFGGPRQQFAQAFGYDPSDPREEVQGGIPQALVMMNSSLVNNPINAQNSRSVLGKLLADTKDNEQAVAELYLRCLAREPSKSEKKAALEHIQAVKSRNEAFEDLLWALMNSTEFLHRR